VSSGGEGFAGKKGTICRGKGEALSKTLKTEKREKGESKHRGKGFRKLED